MLIHFNQGYVLFHFVGYDDDDDDDNDGNGVDDYWPS